MSVLAQAVEASVVTGAIYASVGVGFVLIFRSSAVLSFCQGGFMLLGSFLFYGLVTTNHVGFLPAMLISVAVVTAFGAGVYILVFARTAARAAFSTSVATIGLGGVIVSIVALKYGTSPRALPDVVSTRAFHVFSAVVPTTDIVAVAITVVMVGILLLILKFTSVGTRMQAVADSPGLSIHLGISAARVAALAWAMAAASAAFAGVAFALRSSVDPVGVSNVGLYAFPAIILGGLNSIEGVLAGGMILAVIQQSVQYAIGANWVDIVSFIVMLGVLWWKPSGFFGRADVVRV
ncbi:MAG: branched-chain amino acid ABC transporter permease [Nocardioidaceae bacterium]